MNSFPTGESIPQALIPSLPWEAISIQLQAHYQPRSCTLKTVKKQWLPCKEAVAGMGQGSSTLPIELPEGRFWLLLSQPSTEKIISLAGGEELTETHLRRALLNKEILGWISSLQKLKIMYLGDQGELPDSSGFVEDVQLEIEDTSLHLRLFLPLSLLHALERPVLVPERTDISLLLSLSVGELSLSAEELGDLEKGDLLILPHGSFDGQQGPGRLIYKDKCLAILEIDGDKARLLRHTDLRLVPMEEKSTEPIAATTIPLAVQVEIATLEMSLQELLNLESGHVLPLPAHSESVSLSLRGKTIAKGELVRLGERLGVRIFQIADQTQIPPEANPANSSD